MSRRATAGRGLPVNYARPVDRGDLVVIDEYVISGEEHRHGAAGFVDGESTRVAQCEVDLREYLVLPTGGSLP
jgi:hypothetical protein